MNRSLSFVYLIISGLVLLSCSSDPTAPEDLLVEDRYISVFTELLIINQLDEEQLEGVTREDLKEQVYEEYDVSQEQFERTHSYFQKQPDQQILRLDKIEETLTEERDRLQEQLKMDRKRIADSLSVRDTLSSPDTIKSNNNN